MKSRLITLVLCLVALSGADCTGDKPQPDTPVATRNPGTETFTIHEENLKKQFQDGGLIEQFEITQLADQYHLLRIGTQQDGATRTEAIPLLLEDLVLIIDLEMLRELIACMDLQKCRTCRPFRDPETREYYCYCPETGESHCNPFPFVLEPDDVLDPDPLDDDPPREP